jgi:hypothetical protein
LTQSGLGAHRAVRALRCEVIEPKLGPTTTVALIKTTGDGFLAEFASPITALDCAFAIQQRRDVGTRSTKLVPDYIPRNFGLRFSTKARRASLASAELCRMPPAFEVSTIVVSSELSSAARMMRFEFHCTSGG